MQHKIIDQNLSIIGKALSNMQRTCTAGTIVHVGLLIESWSAHCTPVKGSGIQHKFHWNTTQVPLEYKY